MSEPSHSHVDVELTKYHKVGCGVPNQLEKSKTKYLKNGKEWNTMKINWHILARSRSREEWDCFGQAATMNRCENSRGNTLFYRKFMEFDPKNVHNRLEIVETDRSKGLIDTFKKLSSEQMSTPNALNWKSRCVR